MRFVLSTCYHVNPLIVNPQVSYLRLIYSTIDNRPDNCTRTVTGSVTYQVIGWFVSRANVGFLIPITIINGTAFVALVIAMWIAWVNGYVSHPFHIRLVNVEDVDKAEEEWVPDEWINRVTYYPTTVRCIF